MRSVVEKNLTLSDVDQSFVIKKLDTNDEEMNDFLFTLGCYPGEKITLVSVVSSTYVVVIKDARYSIDEDFARAIIIE